MLDVALWSRFPTTFIEHKIEPALKKRGIRVLKTLSDRTKKVDLSDVAVVLFLYDISSHSEESRIVNLAESHGKKVIRISRKEATWDRNLSHVVKIADQQTGEPMASAHSIPDEKVQAFCDEFESLYKKGVSRKDMVKPLSKYWVRGKLTNENQLNMMIRGLIDGKRAPKSFGKWYDHDRKQENFLRHKSVPQVKIAESSPAPAAKVPDQDQAAYEQLLNEEAEKIARMQAEMKAKDEALSRLTQEYEKLKSENAKLKEQPSDGVVRRAVLAISESVELKFISLEDGYKKLVDFVRK